MFACPHVQRSLFGDSKTAHPLILTQLSSILLYLGAYVVAMLLMKAEVTYSPLSNLQNFPL